MKTLVEVGAGICGFQTRIHSEESTDGGKD